MENYNTQIKELITKYQDQFLNDLEKLIAVPSVSRSDLSEDKMPFGKDVKEAFNVYADICHNLGYETVDCDGYAIFAMTGDSEDYVASIGHLDVVDAGDHSLWNSEPYKMKRDGDILYGRGVNDDKGPLLASLYALKIVQDLGLELKNDVRIIAGGAEETTWECMDYYFKHHKQPIMGFSPDGNFPIVNGEKGIFCYNYHFDKHTKADNNLVTKINCPKGVNYICDELIIEIANVQKEVIEDIVKNAESVEFNDNQVVIRYLGKTALSRNPQRGENAMWKLAEDFKEFDFAQNGFNDLIALINKYYVGHYYGEGAGIFHEDPNMGKTSVCPMLIEENNDGYDLKIDYRYINGVDIDEVRKHLDKCGKEFNATMDVYRTKRMLYVEEDSKLINSLKKAYETVMDEKAEVFTKGGASYARVMDHGVAFGATFDGEDPLCHMPNEHISIASLMKALEIYVYAFIEMATK